MPRVQSETQRFTPMRATRDLRAVSDRIAPGFMGPYINIVNLETNEIIDIKEAIRTNTGRLRTARAIARRITRTLRPILDADTSLVVSMLSPTTFVVHRGEEAPVYDSDGSGPPEHTALVLSILPQSAQGRLADRVDTYRAYIAQRDANQEQCQRERDLLLHNINQMSALGNTERYLDRAALTEFFADNEEVLHWATRGHDEGEVSNCPPSLGEYNHANNGRFQLHIPPNSLYVAFRPVLLVYERGAYMTSITEFLFQPHDATVTPYPTNDDGSLLHPHASDTICFGRSISGESVERLIDNLFQAGDLRGVVSIMERWRYGWDRNSQLSGQFQTTGWASLFKTPRYMTPTWERWIADQRVTVVTSNRTRRVRHVPVTALVSERVITMEQDAQSTNSSPSTHLRSQHRYQIPYPPTPAWWDRIFLEEGLPEAPVPANGPCVGCFGQNSVYQARQSLSEVRHRCTFCISETHTPTCAGCNLASKRCRCVPYSIESYPTELLLQATSLSPPHETFSIFVVPNLYDIGCNECNRQFNILYRFIPNIYIDRSTPWQSAAICRSCLLTLCFPSREYDLELPPDTESTERLHTWLDEHPDIDYRRIPDSTPAAEVSQVLADDDDYNYEDQDVEE